MDTRLPQEIDQHVGRRIREGRLQKGLSQEKLAAALGLSFQQVQKYENGKNRISAGRLSQVAHIFEVPEQWFFGKPVFTFPPDMAPAIPTLLSLCSELDGQAIKALLSAARAMKKAGTV